MNSRSTSRALAAAALASGTLAAVTPAAGADPAAAADAPDGARQEHCVVHVLGQEPNGRYLTDLPTCYPTLAEALADASVSEPTSLAALSAAAVPHDVAAASSITLATHFDGANQTGSSITVSGVDCSGGYVNLSSSWINRISSAINSCPNVNYYDGYDKTGNSQFTSGLGPKNLSTLNNAANSIGYA